MAGEELADEVVDQLLKVLGAGKLSPRTLLFQANLIPGLRNDRAAAATGTASGCFLSNVD